VSLRIVVALPPLEQYSAESGGAVSTVVEALARQWTSRGHDVVVLSHQTETPYLTGEVRLLRYHLPERRPVHRLVLSSVRRVRRYDWPVYSTYLREVQQHVRRVRPDWLLLHNDLAMPALHGLPSNTKVGLTLHNSAYSRSPTRAGTSIRSCTVVTAVSAFIAKETEARFHLPSQQITVLHNGVEVGLYSGSRRKVAADEPLRVAVLGRLLPDKGAHVLLQAVDLLRSRGVTVVPTVVGSPRFVRSTGDGDDPYVRQVRADLDRLGGQHVPHLGRLDVSRLLAEQDVVVVPSLFDDPFPLVSYEGMASGCAVVVSDRGGLPEAAGDAGLVVPWGSSVALAEALEHLSKDRADLVRRQEAGLARVRKRDWSAVADRWLELLAAVPS